MKSSRLPGINAAAAPMPKQTPCARNICQYLVEKLNAIIPPTSRSKAGMRTNWMPYMSTSKPTGCDMKNIRKSWKVEIQAMEEAECVLNTMSSYSS